MKKELKEQQKNSDEINSTINNLNQIVYLEFNKESKEEQEEIERIKSGNERFINGFLQFEINFVDYKKCELKKEQKVQIEHWTKMKMKDIVFDSNIHNWKQNESEFDDLILNKQNLIFLIESDDNIKFGGFISSKIDEYEKWISDENAFLFTFKDNNQMKFDIKKDMKKDDEFFVFHKSSNNLFQIGYHDIWICKQYGDSEIHQNGFKSSFDYQGIENALIGKTGDYCISPKRIMVFQMK